MVKKRKATGRSDRPPTKRLRQKRARWQSMFSFASTPVLVAVPPSLGNLGTIRGHLVGEWTTEVSAPGRLRVTSLSMALHLPAILTREGRVIDFRAEPVSTKLARIQMAPPLRRALGPVNAGTYDTRSRFVAATFGFKGVHSVLGDIQGVFQSVGWLHAGGNLLAGGIGTVVRGPLTGLIFCCAGPRPRQDEPSTPPVTPVAPAECDGTCTARQSGQTHGGENHTDFSPIQDQDGNIITFAPGPGPTGAAQLGYVQGTYTYPPVMGITAVIAAFFQKVEVEITTTAPCVIISATRTFETLNGHNTGAIVPGVHRDPIDLDRSRAVNTPQRWVITDAPGYIHNALGAAPNIIFHRRYTVTATIRRGGPGQPTFERSCTYTVLIRTNAAGNMSPNPQPPP